MAPYSSTLAWKIPWTEEPGRLQSMGSLRVGHDWETLPSLFTFMHWRRQWQLTPVFLPGESQGRGSLVGCHLWGCTESDTTEVTQQQQQLQQGNKAVWDSRNTPEATKITYIWYSPKIKQPLKVILTNNLRCPRPGAAAERSKPMSKKPWLHGRRRA